MKKLLFAVPLVTLVTACGTTNTYDKRVDHERERQEKAVERAVDRAPKWMNELPKSNNAVYANGTAISRDYAMSDMKAKTIAYSHICMAAGGEVDKSSKVYMNDTEVAGTENSEVAIRSMCRKVDITGAEIVDTVRTAENGRFRTYVLVALPTGEANKLQTRKDQIRANENSRIQADKAFRDMERQ